MNPELTKQISERLSKLHDTQVDVASPGTTVQMTSETQGDMVTLSANGYPLVELSSQYRGAIPGEMMALMANGGPKSVFDLNVGDVVQSSDMRGYTSFADAELTETARHAAGLMHHRHTTLGAGIVTSSDEDRSGLVTLQPSQAVESAESDVPSDEVDDEFWKSMGMNGPEDMTPDKLAEISKKLQEFGQSLKRMQREHPTTMGVAVRVKQRTPKKRKRKR